MSTPDYSDPDVRAVADLLAQRWGPGDHWRSLADVRPFALALETLEDAVAVVELMRARADGGDPA